MALARPILMPRAKPRGDLGVLNQEPPARCGQESDLAPFEEAAYDDRTNG